MYNWTLENEVSKIQNVDYLYFENI